MDKTLDYIECAGVRVPADWSVKQLAEALIKRKIRFANEIEIINAFSNAIRMAELGALSPPAPKRAKGKTRKRRVNA